MLYRRALHLVAAVMVAVLIVPLSDAGGTKDKGKEGLHAHHEHFDKCARACNDCQRICDACSIHCAGMVAKGKKEHFKTLQTCQDCADFCATAAQIVSRGGPFAGLICKGCAEACKRCGDECNKFKDDEWMKKCADECFRCQKACEEMLHHVDHDKGKKG
jgi:hypothetical protein